MVVLHAACTPVPVRPHAHAQRARWPPACCCSSCCTTTPLPHPPGCWPSARACTSRWSGALQLQRSARARASVQLAAPRHAAPVAAPASCTRTHTLARHRSSPPCRVLQYGRGVAVPDPDIARTVLASLWMLAEPARLAAGWFGNLQENVRARARTGAASSSALHARTPCAALSLQARIAAAQHPRCRRCTHAPRARVAAASLRAGAVADHLCGADTGAADGSVLLPHARGIRACPALALACCGGLGSGCGGAAWFVCMARHAVAAATAPRSPKIWCCRCSQDLRPLDVALQVAMALLIHAELFAAVAAVSRGGERCISARVQCLHVCSRPSSRTGDSPPCVCGG